MSEHPLKAFRERQDPHMTQDALGKLLGFDRATINRWETGKRLPEPEVLPVICERTGISARELRPDLAEMFGSAT